MPLRSVLARAAPASATSADSGYVSAAARPASATAPTPAESLATARRLGHDFARLPAPGSAGGVDVLQRQDSDDEDDDPSFVVKEPAAKRRKIDPNSAIEKGSIKKTATSFKYKTVGGAKHKETYTDGGRKKTTRSKNLRNTGPQHRNNAQRPAKGEAPKVFNPYGLSVGQQTLNQLAVSHSTPSWAGFRAGGEFANSSLTSPVFNSNVEKKEKPLRSKVENVDQPYDYETQTEYEDLDPKADAKRIVPLVNNPRWDEKRISTRLERLKKLYPKARRIASERRTLTYPFGKKRKRSTFNLASDLHYGLPRRAYDKKAHKKYIEARGQDSEGSDDELEEKPKKKAKKVVAKKTAKKKAATKKAKKKTK